MQWHVTTARRLAVWVADEVIAVTGNLAAEGDLALRLLPGTTAAGLCASTASPRLVDGHAAHDRWVASSQLRNTVAVSVFSWAVVCGQAAHLGRVRRLCQWVHVEG
jgi:hypothetical protein